MALKESSDHTHTKPLIGAFAAVAVGVVGLALLSSPTGNAVGPIANTPAGAATPSPWAPTDMNTAPMGFDGNVIAAPYMLDFMSNNKIGTMDITGRYSLAGVCGVVKNERGKISAYWTKHVNPVVHDDYPDRIDYAVFYIYREPDRSDLEFLQDVPEIEGEVKSHFIRPQEFFNAFVEAIKEREPPSVDVDTEQEFSSSSVRLILQGADEMVAMLQSDVDHYKTNLPDDYTFLEALGPVLNPDLYGQDSEYTVRPLTDNEINTAWTHFRRYLHKERIAEEQAKPDSKILNFLAAHTDLIDEMDVYQMDFDDVRYALNDVTDPQARWAMVQDFAIRAGNPFADATEALQAFEEIASAHQLVLDDGLTYRDWLHARFRELGYGAQVDEHLAEQDDLQDDIELSALDAGEVRASSIFGVSKNNEGEITHLWSENFEAHVNENHPEHNRYKATYKKEALGEEERADKVLMDILATFKTIDGPPQEQEISAADYLAALIGVRISYDVKSFRVETLKSNDEALMGLQALDEIISLYPALSEAGFSYHDDLDAELRKHGFGDALDEHYNKDNKQTCLAPALLDGRIIGRDVHAEPSGP